MNIDFTFLGVNLGQQPEWNFFSHTDWSDPSVWGPALGLFLIPFISAGLSWLSMKISNMANPVDNAQAAASMKSMNIMMPLMSIWICFIMPAAMGLLVATPSSADRDYVLTMKYKKQLDIEDAEKAAIRAEREKELEAKRLETRTPQSRGQDRGQRQHQQEESSRKREAEERGAQGRS